MSENPVIEWLNQKIAKIDTEISKSRSWEWQRRNSLREQRHAVETLLKRLKTSDLDAFPTRGNPGRMS